MKLEELGRGACWNKGTWEAVSYHESGRSEAIAEKEEKLTKRVGVQWVEEVPVRVEWFGAGIDKDVLVEGVVMIAEF